MVIDSVRAMQAHQVLRQAAVAVTAILLAQSDLSATAIGTFELLFYLGYTVSFFWSTGLVQALLSLYSDYDARGKAELLFNSWFLFNLFSVILFLLLLVFREQVLLALTGRTEIDHYFLFLVFLSLSIPAFLLEHLLLLLDRPRQLLFLGVSYSGAYLAVVGFTLFTGGELAAVFQGLILVAFVKYIWLLAIVWRSGYWRLRSDQLGSWLWLSGPLVLYALLGGLILTFDNWLVNFHYRGDEQVFAIFRYGARELPLAGALAGALATAALPVVAADTSRGLQLLRERSRRLAHLLFPIAILLLLTSYWWFPLIFTEIFSPSILIFDIFLLILISRLVFSRTVLMGLRDNRTILVFSVLEVFLNGVLAFLLIGSFGLAGVAAATVIAYTLEKAAISTYLYFRHGIPPGKYVDLPVYLTYSLLLLGALILTISIHYDPI